MKYTVFDAILSHRRGYTRAGRRGFVGCARVSI